MRDIAAGRVNCVVVKNLSRAFRNSANQGHFLEEFIPLYNTRFISLYEPRIDTFLNPEVVHSLEVSITGFLNEQYAYKTSADVRRTFRYKREKGQFIGAFAPYGYAKDPEQKNTLVVDEAAAGVVRQMFSWFVHDGMSKAGIARRLNELGIPNPTAYKRAGGFSYENPHAAHNDGLWNPTTVSRMLQDPLYIGVMRQGKQRVISYKVHKRISVPEAEWFRVEGAVPPIVSRDLFQAAQELHRRDTRTAPGRREVYLFSGLVRCADCRKSMTRRTAKGHVYYACRTHREKSPTRCTRHSIREDVLEQTVLSALQLRIGLTDALSEILDAVRQAPDVPAGPMRPDTLLRQRVRELERMQRVLDGLYLDWKQGELSDGQYHRLREDLCVRIGQLERTVDCLRTECEASIRQTPEEPPELTALVRCGNILGLSRGLLVELVDAVYIHGDGEVEICFRFADPFPNGAAAWEDPGQTLG